MKKTRDMFIFKTIDSYYVYLTLSIIEEILTKEQFAFFIMLEKEEQLKFLNLSKISYKDISKKTSQSFRFSYIN